MKSSLVRLAALYRKIADDAESAAYGFERDYVKALRRCAHEADQETRRLMGPYTGYSWERAGSLYLVVNENADGQLFVAVLRGGNMHFYTQRPEQVPADAKREAPSLCETLAGSTPLEVYMLMKSMKYLNEL